MLVMGRGAVPGTVSLSTDGAFQLASSQTPLTAKRPTDVDDIGEGPSTPSSSKVRRLVFDHESPSPLGSSQVEVPGTPLPINDTPATELDLPKSFKVSQ